MQVSAGMTGDPVLAGLTSIRNHGCTRGEFEGITERHRRQATLAFTHSHEVQRRNMGKKNYLKSWDQYRQHTASVSKSHMQNVR